VTLSALSGSALGGTLLDLAYVLGMTFPLLVMALAYDKLRLRRSRRHGTADRDEHRRSDPS
jgi:cytochrome c-type biogenesis protein